jgi:hypothetical protein
MRTKEAIPKGQCVIPIFFRRSSSMVMEGEQGGVRPRNGVNCKVDWRRRSVSSDEIKNFGELVDEVSVNVFIAPEVKVPKGKLNEAVEWTMTEELHPFWYVKRAQPEDKNNMELVFLSTQQILACDIDRDFRTKKGVSLKSVMEVSHVQYPCLVNTMDVEPDVELILEWSQLAVKGPAKAEKGKNAYDQLVASEKTAKKAKHKG